MMGEDIRKKEKTLWTEDEINEKILASAEEQPVPESLLPVNVKRQLENSGQKKRAARVRHVTELVATIALVCVIGGAIMRAPGSNKSSSDLAQNMTGSAESAEEMVEERVEGSFVRTERSPSAGDLYHLASGYEEVYESIAFMNKNSDTDIIFEGENTNSTDYMYSMGEPSADGDESAASPEFSETNVQQSGVDESDIIKTDGQYIYIVRDRCVEIMDIREGKPEEIGQIRPEMSASDYLIELYVDENRLYLVISGSETQMSNSMIAEDMEVYSVSSDCYTKLQTYDISDRSNPEYLGSVTQDGYYYTSRKVGDDVYLFTTMDLYGYTEENVYDAIPYVQGERVEADCIYIPERAQSELIISSVNGNHPETVVDRIVVMNNCAKIYMGTDAIYLYNYKYLDSANSSEITEIAKFSYKDGYLDAVGAASVAGCVEDTFAISEKDGYLRVLTTDWTAAERTNQLYVLDETLELCGEITNIADEESIYAARYLGNMAYFITYRNTDPLYVADLSNPEDPQIMGNVEISGFSDYIHPYGDGKLLGIGYETDERSRREGVKLVMFDISDIENPQILEAVVMDDMSYTPADDCYKTVMIDADKNLIGFWAIEDGANAAEWNYFIYRWEDGAFREVLAEKPEEDILWGASSVEARGLYAGDYFYLVTKDSIRTYDMEADFSLIDEVEF